MLFESEDLIIWESVSKETFAVPTALVLNFMVAKSLSVPLVDVFPLMSTVPVTLL